MLKPNRIYLNQILFATQLNPPKPNRMHSNPIDSIQIRQNPAKFDRIHPYPTESFQIRSNSSKADPIHPNSFDPIHLNPTESIQSDPIHPNPTESILFHYFMKFDQFQPNQPDQNSFDATHMDDFSWFLSFVSSIYSRLIFHSSLFFIYLFSDFLWINPAQWRSEGPAGPATAGGPQGWRGPPGRSSRRNPLARGPNKLLARGGRKS